MINAFIKTYGCQANVADSGNLAKYLVGLGCLVVAREEDADLIIVNSCAIREKAEEKLFSYLGSLTKFKRAKRHLAICVIGCVASYKKDEILRRFENVSFVFGAKEGIEKFKSMLVDVISTIETKKSLYTGDNAGTTVRGEGEPFPRSMINIMRGCNNYCSYCIVPFTTGRERSFAMPGIIDRIRDDVAKGAKEITLLGQNVNSYKDPETGQPFSALLENIAKIDGDFWVRFVSPHPKDMNNEVLEVMAKHNKKLCSYVHFPLQSGSNKILENMNRTYSVETYLGQVETIKKYLPNVTLTTDIIVGFPGETEEDYLNTREVMESVRFNTIFSFIYSPRKYTKAALLKDDCDYKVKLERLKQLQKRQREIATEDNKKLIGKTLSVLLEGILSSGHRWGRTEGNIKVIVTEKIFAEKEISLFVDIEIIGAQMTNLKGKPCHEKEKAIN